MVNTGKRPPAKEGPSAHTRSAERRSQSSRPDRPSSVPSTPMERGIAKAMGSKSLNNIPSGVEVSPLVGTTDSLGGSTPVAPTELEVEAICARAHEALRAEIMREVESSNQLLTQRVQRLEAELNNHDEVARTLRGDVNSLLEEQRLTRENMQAGFATLTERMDQLYSQQLAMAPVEPPTESQAPEVVVQEPSTSAAHRSRGVAPEGNDAQESHVGRGKHSSRRRSKSRKKRSKKKKKDCHDDDYDEPSSSSSSNSSSSSESESGTDDSSSGSDQHRGSARRTNRPFREKKKGKKHRGLKELRAPNPLYDRLLSYRLYRLRDTSQSRSSRATAKVKDFIKRMELKLKDHYFSGEDPVLVLDFLVRFCKEADTQGMSEAQAYLAVPYFLKGFALNQFESVTETATSSEGGVTCWPEAVQYLLRSYATSTNLQQALLELRDIRQRSGEDEVQYSTRLNTALCRCGNVHPPAEVMTMFTDGLDPAISSLVSRHRAERPRVSYIQLVQFAREEGAAYRARQGSSRRPIAAPVRVQQALQRPRRSVNFMEQSPPNSAGSSLRDPNADQMLLFGESMRSSIPTTELPSTEFTSLESEEVVDEVLAINPRREGHYASRRPAINPSTTRNVPAARLPYQTPALRAIRPGWVDRPLNAAPPPGQQRIMPEGRNRLICYSCYMLDKHISPECDLKLSELDQVVANYDMLTEQEKARVPKDSYERARGAHLARARRVESPPDHTALATASHSPKDQLNYAGEPRSLEERP